MKRKIPYPNIKYYTFAKEKDFLLESGEYFGPITVAYETFGTLNENKDNAIFVIHALTGDTHVTGDYDPDNTTPGWWDTLVGKNKAIDTEKYFIICANYFGGCMGTTSPSSIDPETGKEYGLKFPMFTVTDMVKVQKELIDYLGIKKLKCIIGGSLGGMLTLEWNVLYPDMMENSIIIAAAHKTSPQIIAFYEVGRNAILSDPNFNNGDYYNGNFPERGLAIARMVAHITYLSKGAIESKFGRDIKRDILETDQMYGIFGPMFQVESYLRYQGRKFVSRFDANSYLYLTKAMDMYDMTRGKNRLNDIVAKFKSRILIVTFTSDWHFSPQESWEIVKALMNEDKEVTYVNIDSPYGHDAFLLKNEELEKVIKSFLSNHKDNDKEEA
ncbi:MAG TPA: homoserine O-acetyltransferase [Spirochaetota bacterium]|nr:homoserine O-acetyltransferase [Spirochaetota bacterium]HOL58226.1 homoserine O-acetyltransferase [Spirochaetota bacterium]HPP04153.1 homoserine O-acetyltransferase [Spirochaetota bacterium]